MDLENGSELASGNQTKVERTSDRELVMTRTFNGPARIVFDAWTKPELLMRWWAPRSFGLTLTSCDIDLRVGGKYSFVFAGEGEQQYAFFGTYKEIERHTRLMWTDEEEAGDAFTTVTFTEKSGKTALSMHQRYASKESLDGALSGVSSGTCETFAQLEQLLPTLS
jgi:uncharacterized protein YndB with AHSA1/START domain